MSSKFVSKISFRLMFLVCAIFYVLIGVSSNYFGWVSEDARWNVEAAKLLPSHEFYAEAYRLSQAAPPYGAPIGYPPLLLYITYPFVLLGETFGYQTQEIARWYIGSLYVVDCLVIYLVLNLVRKLNPFLSVSYFVSIMLILFFSGFFWYTTGFIGHPEILVLLFSLLAIGELVKKIRINFVKIGIWLGLLLGAKQTAIFIEIPILLYIWYRYKFSTVLLTSITTSFIFLLILLPLLVTNFPDTIYGVYGYTKYLIIQGPNWWWFADAILKKVFGIFTGLTFTIPWINYITISGSVIMTVLFLRAKKTLNLTLLLGLLVLNWLWFCIAGKWVSFHYFSIGMIFLLLWESANERDFPMVWVSYTAVLLAANFSLLPVWQPLILLVNTTYFIYIACKLSKLVPKLA